MDDYKGQLIINSEKRFVYHESVNRGHVQLPRMVINCLGLSSVAKIVYGIISGYIFEHGKTAFPSVARIAMGCNCTKKTTIKYIDELVEKGFIIKERNGKRRTNNYYLVDADKVQHLQVSEMFWGIITGVYRDIETSLYEDIYNGVIDILENISESNIDFKDIPVNPTTKAHVRNILINNLGKDDETRHKLQNREEVKPEIDSFFLTRKKTNDVNSQDNTGKKEGAEQLEQRDRSASVDEFLKRIKGVSP
ncbi:hypothetical protein GRF59_05490 [Paenibacillus sp. HJL G12]|uniref:Helix-turn-helix domain-containing protein n=1 Tax=Paenibacillus dendrobii TaxID=2691084 RepID=A0A7X3IFR2_9BACL|nr:helix-turn-helix domain-containing protein [Paenibacillus dendrobii]MWV43077.1 hypothetical protein [Paenibacillus dendrobii]